MSYTVLARRYRSATFDEVIGQEHVAQTLKKAIASDRVAHAYLFCGTRGTGKTSMARILAKALNCQNADKPTVSPCGKCDVCISIARGDDIDVQEIDAASNTQVDKTREVVIDNAAYSPARSRFKIYIIDEAHMLSKSSFNALLKTLEEPPAHVKFIFATTEPEKIPATILSRCQRYDFRNIPSREIAGHLKAICKKEKIKADDDALLLVAQAGAGSMRDALSLLDRLLSAGEENLTVEMIEQMLGMPRAQVIFDLAGAIGDGDVKKTLAGAGKLIAGGLSSEALVAAMIEHLRNLLIVSTCGPDTELVEVAGIPIEKLAEQAKQFDPAALSQDIAMLEELRRNLRTSQAGRALLDATLVRLTLADQFTSINALLTNPAPIQPALKKKSEPTPAVTAEPEPEDDDLPSPGKVWDTKGPSISELQKKISSAATPIQPEANIEPVDPNDFDAVMTRLRGAIHLRSPGIDGFLSAGKFVGINNGMAVIEIPPVAAAMLDRNGKREIIQDELSVLLKQTVGVKFQADESKALDDSSVALRREVVRRTPAPRPQSSEPPPSIRITPELREQLRNTEPLLKAVMDELGAEIVKIE